jgi:hypothetical protein
VLEFQSTLTLLCSFLPQWLECAIHHSVLSAGEGVSSDCIHDTLMFKVQWRNTLPSVLQCRSWWSDECAIPFGHCWECMESTLHILNVSISCWWGYSKRLLERFQLL